MYTVSCVLVNAGVYRCIQLCEGIYMCADPYRGIEMHATLYTCMDIDILCKCRYVGTLMCAHR